MNVKADGTLVVLGDPDANGCQEKINTLEGD